MNNDLFNIDLAIEKIRKAVRPYPPAAMFQLADEGFNTPFQQLIACIISIRTYDEVSIPVAKSLFAEAKTAESISQLSVEQIAELIQQSTYAERKASQIKTIAQRIVSEFGGELPCDKKTLLSFAGVGPKCAHLALGIACGQPYISVDVHVHRVTNRWGYIQAKTPEKTMVALEEKLPQAYWIEINRLLVPFGKHMCQGKVPRCKSCSLFEMCQRVDVRSYRK